MGNLKRKREGQEESLTLDCEWVRGGMIGRGGFGSVYEASFKKPKLISHDFPGIIAVKSAPFSRVLELVKENSLLQLFGNCRNVIGYLGDDVTVGADGNLMYNVFMEFADRGTLWDLISDYGGLGLKEPQVSIYTDAILRGLEFIHDMGYVHCDIKPQNILLVTKGWRSIPKLGDFGLARLDSPEHHQECRGTPLYVSPEMVIDGIQERPSDIWALGCVVLNMLTGRGHWDIEVDAGFDDIAPIIAHESPVIPAGLSEEAKDFLAKCFVRNPNERFTASMLLCHPFATKHSIVEEEEDEHLEQTSSDSYLDDCDSSCISHQSWSSDEEAEDSRPPKASKMVPLALTFPGALRRRFQC